MSENIENTGDENLEFPPSFLRDKDFVSDVDIHTIPIQVQIEGLYEAERDRQAHQFIMLTDGERRLPISIGTPEAKAILDPIENEVPDRPMTHDLLRAVIDRFGATVERVMIDDLWHGVFYAKLVLQKGDEEIIIDARPSDAIAIAVRFQAPIFVQSKIFELAYKE
jgi:uncharacterized protein